MKILVSGNTLKAILIGGASGLCFAMALIIVPVLIYNIPMSQLIERTLKALHIAIPFFLSFILGGGFIGLAWDNYKSV